MFDKIGCKLIGWNWEILSTCGEASHRQLRKYMSAIIIMMILWGTIGYCFAENYLNMTGMLQKSLVSFAFIVIVLSIERVIILTVGKAPLMKWMRILLAIAMAMLGSCIFDQLIFRNDIQQEVASRREDVVAETVAKRLAIYDSDIRRISFAQDSLQHKQDELYAEIEKNPTTTVTTVSTQEQIAGVDSEGKPIKESVRSVNKTVVPNPRLEQAQGNAEQLKIYEEQLEQLRLEKRDIDKKILLSDKTQK